MLKAGAKNIQSAPANPSKAVGIKGRNPPKPSMILASMPLRVMLRLVKIITSKTDFLTLTLEFSVKNSTPSCLFAHGTHYRQLWTGGLHFLQ